MIPAYLHTQYLDPFSPTHSSHTPSCSHHSRKSLADASGDRITQHQSFITDGLKNNNGKRFQCPEVAAGSRAQPEKVREN